MSNDRLHNIKSQISLLHYESYVQGYKDTLKAIEKMDMMTRGALEEVFGCDELKSYSATDVLERYGIKECLKRIEMWEKEKENSELKIGDVVKLYSASGKIYVKGVYVGQSYADDCYWLITHTSEVPQSFSISNNWRIVKTGRWIDIKGILEEIE